MLIEPSRARQTVVDVADWASLNINATEVIERTGIKMIEMRTQPSGFCCLETTPILNDTCPILRSKLELKEIWRAQWPLQPKPSVSVITIAFLRSSGRDWPCDSTNRECPDDELIQLPSNRRQSLRRTASGGRSKMESHGPRLNERRMRCVNMG